MSGFHSLRIRRIDLCSGQILAALGGVALVVKVDLAGTTFQPWPSSRAAFFAGPLVDTLSHMRKASSVT
jgi:hypothetical protein